MMTFVDGLYGVLQSGGWQDHFVVFAGRLTMLGIDCELRQTMTRRGSDEFHIRNEEKLPDTRWHVVDEFYSRGSEADSPEFVLRLVSTGLRMMKTLFCVSAAQLLG